MSNPFESPSPPASPPPLPLRHPQTQHGVNVAPNVAATRINNNPFEDNDSASHEPNAKAASTNPFETSSPDPPKSAFSVSKPFRPMTSSSSQTCDVKAIQLQPPRPTFQPAPFSISTSTSQSPSQRLFPSLSKSPQETSFQPSPTSPTPLLSHPKASPGPATATAWWKRPFQFSMPTSKPTQPKRPLPETPSPSSPNQPSTSQAPPAPAAIQTKPRLRRCCACRTWVVRLGIAAMSFCGLALMLHLDGEDTTLPQLHSPFTKQTIWLQYVFLIFCGLSGCLCLLSPLRGYFFARKVPPASPEAGTGSLGSDSAARSPSSVRSSRESPLWSGDSLDTSQSLSSLSPETVRRRSWRKIEMGMSVVMGILFCCFFYGFFSMPSCIWQDRWCQRWYTALGFSVASCIGWWWLTILFIKSLWFTNSS